MIINFFKVIPEKDLFAFAFNLQVLKYILWNPHQVALTIDAFSISWTNIKFKAFPPFSLIGASTSKIKWKGASGITIILVEYTVLVPKMVSPFQDFPVILPPNILALPFNQDQQHPLYSKMKLLVLHLSEHPSDIQGFHQISQMLYWNPGDQPQGQDISLYSEDGTALWYQGIWIPIL